MFYYDNNTQIEFDNVDKNLLAVGSKISAAKYITNGDEITGHLPIINAIDIDWNDAYVNEYIKNINTTGDLLSVFRILFNQYRELYNELGNDEITIAAAGDKLDNLESSVNTLLNKVNSNESKLNSLISYLNISEEDLNN